MAGLTALKGGAPAAGDKIYIYNGATLTVESDLACLQIILGQTSAGAAGAGNRYGLVSFGAVTVTWDGNSTNTNSGVISTPTSADASSKGCLTSANGTSFTNSAGASNTSNKWTFSIDYGTAQIINSSLLYMWGNVFNRLCCDSARSNYTPIFRKNTIGAGGTTQNIFFIGSTSIINMYCDFRYIDITVGAISGNFMSFVTVNTGNIASGCVVDYAGFKFSGGAGGFQMNVPPVTTAPYYIANDRITYADTRQTQIVPTGLTFSNPGTGGEATFTISNPGSYAATDEIHIYNATGDTFMGCVRLSKYTADSLGRISGLTDGTAYTFYAKASSDGFNFSDATANADAVTPTHLSYDFPAVANVLDTDTVDGVTGTATVPDAGNVLAGTGTYGAGGTAITPTSDKLYSAAEEATRNTDPLVANVIKDVGYKILNSSKVGTFDEAARNTDPLITNVKTGTEYKILNVAKTGTYEGGGGGTSTDPGVANVIKDVEYMIDDVAKVGTFDEAARNTDPGVANVVDGVTYKILNVAKEGTLVGDSTDPGVDKVVFGTEYVINGVDKVGAYDETLRFSDPGTQNVKAPVGYKYQGSNKVGTLIPTIGIGGSNRIVSDGVKMQLI